MNYQDQVLLIKHLKEGKEKAFIYLVDTYNKRMFAYALTLSHDDVMAQDITQNVFLKTWERRKKMDIKTSLQNYLFRSVHNEFLNLYKKNRATLILEQKYVESLERITSNYDENSLTKPLERINLEIQNLPPKCKEVFLLSRKEGLTNIEISDYLNITPKTVEAHITKAFSVLRKTVGGKIHGILLLLFGEGRKDVVKMEL